MITISFHGYDKDDRLPETVEIDGAQLRVVNGVLAASGAAVEMEEQERDRKHKRFIEAVLHLVKKEVEAMGDGH